jgi:non-ribosomal peptide synthase protein (TIGR01720 family)
MSNRGDHYFNQSIVLSCKKHINEQQAAGILDIIVRHHDIFRAVYRRDTDTIIQENRGITDNLYEVRSIHINDTEDVKDVIRQAGCIMHGSFDLQDGPLLKAALFHAPRTDYLLIIIHHLVVDGMSWRILLEDFGTLFSQLEKNQPLTLPLKTDSFKDWALALIRYAESEELEQELDYWRRVTHTIVQDIPCGHPVDESENIHEFSDNIVIHLDGERTGLLLKEVNQTYGTSINDILLTALSLALHGWHGIEKTAIHLEGHGREDIHSGLNINRTIGFFTSKYPVILDITGAGSISQKIIKIKETLRAIPNKGIGYGILKYVSSQPAAGGVDMGIAPEIIFNYMGRIGQETRKDFFTLADINTGPAIDPQMKMEYTLEINASIINSILHVSIHYNTNRLTRESMEVLAQLYLESVCAIITHCMEIREADINPSAFTYPHLSPGNYNHCSPTIYRISMNYPQCNGECFSTI